MYINLTIALFQFYTKKVKVKHVTLNELQYHFQYKALK